MSKHDLAGATTNRARRHRLSRRRSALMVSVALIALGTTRPVLSQAADALPTGGSVIGGSASFSTPTVGTLQVGQTTDRALIEWASFDIGSNATVNFVQPSTSAIALNRVVGGGAPSQIAGHLNSNGIVAVINSNGVMFAGTANVNVGGLIASTADIDNASFMTAATLNFSGSTSSSSEIVVQAGAQISIADQGLAMLFAPVVRNQGLINARLGHVTLAAGSSATLDLDGTGFLEIGVGNNNALVQNSGVITANGGNILMSARAVSAVIDQVINTGTLSVGSASLDGSEIVLQAAGGNARIGGSATGKLGVTASGNVQVASNLNVDSGSATLTGQRVYGAGDVNVASGALTLNVNPAGVAGVAVSGSRINGALDVIGSVSGAATVNIGPGEYTEAANGVGTYGGAGGQNFGLFVFKNNVTLRGVDASGNLVTNADNVVAYVRSANETGFGAQNFVSGSGVTIEGLGFRPRTAASGRKTLEVNGNAFTLRNSVIDNRSNPTEVNFYISDFNDVTKPRVESFTLQNNIFYGGTTASSMVLVAGGTGRNTDATNRIFSGNRIIGSSLLGQSGFRIEGQATATAPWAVLTTGPVTITNNSFDNIDAPIRTLGVLTLGLDWNAVFRNNGNTFLDGAVLAYDGSSLNARGAPNAGGDLDYRITSRISDSVTRALAGDTVQMLDGTYSLGTSQLVLNRSITLLGQSQGGTIIDGRASSGNGLGTISVFADNTTLGNFTLYGSEVSGGNYGIKVQPNPAGHVNTPGGDDQRINNIAISDVTVRGSRRAELDINGAVGVTVTNFTADGRRVANSVATEGAGVQITDSANVTLSGIHTLGNNWGAVALYQSNKASAYDGQTTNINIDASQNIFEDSIGLFTQLESTTQGFGQLNLTGFNYAVRNTGHRSDGSQFTYFRTDLTDATNFALNVGAANTSSIEGYSGTAFTNIFSVANGLSINAALRDARNGATVNIRPGNYLEGITGVDYFGGVGAQSFGLYVPKDNITLRGVDASGNAITSASNVAAFITSQYQSAFGAQHFVSGTGVTVEGLGFKPVTGGDNKTFEVIGDAFTMRNSVIDNRGNQTVGNFYISTFDTPGADTVESFTLRDNIFYGAAYTDTVPRGIVTIAAGVGRNTPSSSRVFSGNSLIGSVTGQIGIQVRGVIPSLISYQAMPSGAVTITGNSFDVDIPVRSWGELTQGLAWNDIFQGNAYTRGAVLAFQGNTTNARDVLLNGNEQEIRITSKIGESVTRAINGDTVRMRDGTYNLGTSRLVIDKSISLVGQSQAGTIIDGRAVTGGHTMLVAADNISLGQFTLWGSDVGSNYGIKVQPNPTGYNPNQRLLNFAISDVTVRGSARAELDLNGVIGATITNFTADGRRVANNAATQGAGVQITDSANVTLTNVHALGNIWGSVALYQANKAGAYNGQTTNININASQNIFEDALGHFSQLESTTQGFGQLNLTGFNYAVRNLDHRAGDDLENQFTFFRTSLNDATNFALTVGTASSSSIEGYTGTALTNVFTVSNGLSINAATRDVRAGGTVNVGAGTYAETVAIARSMTLDGAGKTGANATSITGGITISGSPSGLVLSDFAVSGSGNGTSVISNSGTITGLTMSGVRIDGGNVADRHGFIGGQIGGDIAIMGSDFVNIRGWAAFDTRSGAGGNDGAQISSAVFSNNLIDNTIGGIAFRQQIGAATLPDVTISGNTVRNVGNATNSFGAIFKAFNAGTVNFTGNNVSDIGTSGFAPTGEAAYGAALMARSVSTLNVSGNTFTNNNQVFAVEPNRGLAAVTNFSNNSFVNNGYSIYLPTSLTGANTINFGTGNNFTSGARTVQHIVWRSSAGLDLTNVRFNGALASTLDLNGRFALADLITDGLDRSGAGLARLVSGNIYVTTGSGNDAAVRAATLSLAGDTINLSSGTHILTDTLFLQKDGVSVLGQGQGATIINASGHNSYGIRVNGGGVTLGGFTLNGSSAAVGNSNYGIKVEKAGDVDTRNTGFTIRNVAINGSRKNGLDINSAVGALIDGVSVSGVTNGNGIAISDSANVTVRNSSTTGNAWGGLALYQSNNLAGGGTNQQLTGITVDSNNNFSQAAGLYLQDSSSLLNPGTLSIQGYGFTVRNSTHRSDGAQFTFFEKTAQNAFDYSVNLDTPADSVVQGWNGSANSADFYVGRGTRTGVGSVALSLQTALGASGSGAAINVASGAYAESASVSGARTLNLGDVTLNSLSLSGAGSSLKGQLTLTGSFTANAPLTLTGNTSISATGNIGIGGLSGNVALTLSGNAVSLGLTSLGSLTATGATITTAGVTTSGAQRYTGATTLNGSYATGGNAFTVTGGSTLAGNTSIATGGGNASFGTLAGAHGFAVNAANGNVTLGVANGLTSLAATGSAITSSGASTSGAQSYTGATTLGGAYSTGGGSFAANGATTLGSATTVATGGGNASFGTISGANSLGVNAGTGNVTLGAVSGLGALTATGATIATLGAATSGNQAYTGATTLRGAYTTGGGSFAVNGAGTLGSATTVATGGGNASFGALGGANSLGVNAGTGNVTLGAVNGLTSLTASGASITSAGAATSGAQLYTGATTLGGTYNTGGGAFAVNGSTTLGGATTIATGGGNASFASIGGANSLGVNAGGGTVNLGAVTGLSALTATGTTISTGGAVTTGAQNYVGATTLRGAYTTGGGNFGVNGATTLGSATTVATGGGNASFGTVGGGNSLGVSAGTGNVTLGNVNGLTSLATSGTTITTAGATTSGGQSYVGATTLGGAYTSGGDFTVSGATTLASATTIATSSGNASFGIVDAALAGGQAMTLDAGNAIATLGTLGAQTRLGAVSVHAGQTVLNGASNAANSFGFTGGPGATVQLTQGNTVFDTTLPGNGGGAITIASNLVGTVNGQQNVSFIAGNGLTADSGNVAITNVGSDAIRLGTLSVIAHNFSAATVKLASDFKSLLSGSQLFTSNTLDTLGNVLADVQGSESGPIRAGGSVEMKSGGSGTGSIIAGGPVQLNYTSDVIREVSSQSSVSVASSGAVGGSINATGLVAVNAVGPVSSTVTTDSTVDIASQGEVSGAINASGAVGVHATGPVSSAVTSSSGVTIASQGAVSGAINASGAVDLNAAGPVSSSVTSSSGVTIASQSTVSGAINASGAVDLNATGPVSSAVTSFRGITIASLGAVSGVINASGAVDVKAVGAVSSSVKTSGAASIASGTGVSSIVNAGAGVNVTSTKGNITGSITATGPVNVNASTGSIGSSISTSGNASVTSGTGSVSSTISAGGAVSVAAPGAVTSTITSGGSISLSSNTPVAVQVNGGSVSVNAPGGKVGGVFGEIKTGDGGSFVVNDQSVVGDGKVNARQIIIDSFLQPAGGTVGVSGEILLPSNLSLGLIAPAGAAPGQRPVIVNTVEDLGTLLGQGYTAIVIQMDESGLETERKSTD